MILILAAAQMLAPDGHPTFSGTTTRGVADVALCYTEQFGRQKDLRVATSCAEGRVQIDLTSRAFFKQTREGTIIIEDRGSDRLVRFWLRRVEAGFGVPAHLQSCLAG